MAALHAFTPSPYLGGITGKGREVERECRMII